MTKNYTLDLQGLPEFLMPKLRLFLSVDIIGSTAAKQKEDNFFKDPRRANGSLTQIGSVDTDDGIASIEDSFSSAAKWLKTSVVFYESFSEEFGKAWSGIVVEAKNLPKGALTSEGDSPKFWKAAGDELLFYKDITDWMQVVLTIGAWVIAMKRVRERIQEAYGGATLLDVKGAAWLAGFPVVNTAFCVNPAPSEENSELGKHIDADFAKSPVCKNLLYTGHLFGDPTVSEIFNKYPKPKNDKERIDFIGPLIDLGFRVSQHADAERMALSMEVVHAFIRANIRHRGFCDSKDGFVYNFADNQALSDFPSVMLEYAGRTSLKGISGSRGYPIFKLNVGLDDPIVMAEAKLLPESKQVALDSGDLRRFCAEYFGRHSVFAWPYLVDKNGNVIFDEHECANGYTDNIGAVIVGHQKRLDELKELWKRALDLLKRIDAKLSQKILSDVDGEATESGMGSELADFQKGLMSQGEAKQ